MDGAGVSVGLISFEGRGVWVGWFVFVDGCGTVETKPLNMGVSVGITGEGAMGCCVGVGLQLVDPRQPTD